MTQTSKPKLRPGLRARLNAGVAWLALVLVAFLNLLPAFAWPYQLELLSHFRPQAGLAALMLALAFLQLRSRSGLILSALLILWSAVEILPWYLPMSKAPVSQSANAGRRALKLLLSNMLFYNDDTRGLKALIEREKPDLVVLQELHVAHLALMKQWRKTYPFSHAPEAASNLTGIWSRYPLSRLRILPGDPRSNQAIAFQLDWQGRRLEVLAVHPNAPLKASQFALRNTEFAALPELVKGPGEHILIGDLNTSSWSPYYRRFAQASGLYNARQGFGLKPSWPAAMPGLFRIAIDHVLLSPSLQTLDFRIGPDLGSDHLPVLVTIGD